MPFFVLLVVFLLFVLVSRVAQSSNRNALLARGLEARGLILQASSLATETTYASQRFEVRNLTLDVEVPGRQPYEVSVSPMIPRICEALPGVTLDLRVDPKNPSNIAIVGPSGSSGWLAAAAAVPGQTWTTMPSGVPLPKGCGTLIVVLVAMSLALASLLSFMSSSKKPHAPAPAATHAAPPVKPVRGPARPPIRTR